MNTRSARQAVGVLLIGTIAASVAVAQKVEVKTEFDRAADFAALTTYQWLKSPPVKTATAPDAATNPGLSQEVLEPYIIAAVDRELTSRGMRVVDTEPQVHVVYYAALNVGMDSAVLGSYYQYLTGWTSPIVPGSAPSISAKIYEEGSIVVDIVSTKANTAIWRGSAATRINHEHTTEKRVARINEAIRRMFDKFPKRRQK